MSPHLSICLRWQWANAVLSAFLQPDQQKGSMSISHHGISHVLWGGGPSGTLPFTFGTGYAHGTVQSHHSPGGTIPVCVFHIATAISADLCKSRVSPLKLVDLLWDKRGTTASHGGWNGKSCPLIRAGPLMASPMQTWVWMRPKSRIMTADFCGQDISSRTPHLFAKSPCLDSQICRGGYRLNDSHLDLKLGTWRIQSYSGVNGPNIKVKQVSPSSLIPRN